MPRDGGHGVARSATVKDLEAAAVLMKNEERLRDEPEFYEVADTDSPADQRKSKATAEDKSANCKKAAETSKKRRASGDEQQSIVKWNKTKHVAPMTGASDDCADGERDNRQTSHAQRYVFKANIAEVDPELAARYNKLKSKDCKIRGKEKLANEIVNSYVPRDAGWGGMLEPKNATIKKLRTKSTEDTNTVGEYGLPKRMFIATKYNGNDASFAAALEEGECWEGADGMYYYKAAQREHIDSEKVTAQGVTAVKVDSKDYRIVIRIV